MPYTYVRNNKAHTHFDVTLSRLPGAKFFGIEKSWGLHVIQHGAYEK